MSLDACLLQYGMRDVPNFVTKQRCILEYECLWLHSVVFIKSAENSS